MFHKNNKKHIFFKSLDCLLHSTYVYKSQVRVTLKFSNYERKLMDLTVLPLPSCFRGYTNKIKHMWLEHEVSVAYLPPLLINQGTELVGHMDSVCSKCYYS